MDLSSELISQFVKVTKAEKPVNNETTVYGTITRYNDSTYVKIDGSDQLTPITTTADYLEGERVMVLIKDHAATVTGNISSPSARTDTVNEVKDNVTGLGSKIDEFDTVLADVVDAQIVTTENLLAETARIDELAAKNVEITGQLDANSADIENLVAKDVEIEGTLTANAAEIENLKANTLTVESAEAKYATIENLNATNADIYNLNAAYGEFKDLTTEQLSALDASVKNLDAEKLDADEASITYATIDNLESNYATIKDLTATNANVTNLSSDVADIDTLIFGSASGETIQTSFANAVIAQLGDAQIKAAMIESLSASQIKAGDIITNNVRVMSEDGSLIISDETIQISDENRVRVQIGKDAANDYSINIWDADGNLMFSEGGITDSAIKEAIIRNDMVASDANIAASKLDISSLFSVINEDGSHTLNASKILMDAEGQTLDISFTEMTSDISTAQETADQNASDIASLTTTINSQGTDISVIQGQISSKVWQQDITEATKDIATESSVSTLSTQYSELNQEVDSISATVASHTTQISNKADSSTVTEVSDKVTEIEADLDGFKTSVSETYATKTALATTQADIDNLEIGGTNLVAGTSDEWVDKVIGPWTGGLYLDVNGETALQHHFSDYGVEPGDWITFAIDLQAINKPLYFRVDTFDEALSNQVIKYGTHITTGNTGRSIITFQVDAAYPIFNTYIGTTGEIEGNTTEKYKAIKVEKGNRATDWSPAPEDLYAVETRVSVAETAIEQNAEAIALRATKTELTDLQTDLADNYYTITETDAQIKVSADSIISTVTALETTLENDYSTTSEMESAIEQSASSITATVSATYATKTELSDTDTKATNAATAANNAQADIDNLEIGGTNLVAGTSDEWVDKVIGTWTGGLYLDVNGEAVLNHHCSDYGVEPGDWITFAIDLQAINKPLCFRVDTYDETLSSYVVKYGNFITIGNTGRSILTFQVDATYPIFNTYIGTTGEIEGNTTEKYKAIKVEKGNRATDWSPAPEDVDSKIEDTVDEIYTSIVEQRAEIAVERDSVLASVLESYVETSEYETYKKETAGELELLSNSLNLRFTESSERSDAIDDYMQGKFDEIYKHFEFSADGLTIKAGEGEMSLRLDNDIIYFEQNGNTFGQWDGSTFVTDNIDVKVKQQARFGGFEFQNRDDGSLVFVKVNS